MRILTQSKMLKTLSIALLASTTTTITSEMASASDSCRVLNNDIYCRCVETELHLGAGPSQAEENYSQYLPVESFKEFKGRGSGRNNDEQTSNKAQDWDAYWECMFDLVQGGVPYESARMMCEIHII